MKHFKRFRQAVLLNVQLADFYLARGRDNLTVDQWSTCLLSWQKLADLYETEQWKQLYFGLIKRIVDYFDQTSRAYLKFTSAICSFANFSAETRLYYWQKLSNSMNSLDEASDARLDQSTFCHPFTIEFLNFREIISVPHMSLHHFDLKLKSVFPSAITVKNIKVRFGIMRKPNSNQQQEYSNEVVYRNEEILELQPGCDTQLTVYSDKVVNCF